MTNHESEWLDLIIWLDMSEQPQKCMETQRGEMWHLKVRFPYIHEVLNGLDFVANLHTFELLAAYLVATKNKREKPKTIAVCY